MPGHFYHFSFLRRPPKQNPRFHELRDSDAFAELVPTLCAQGYDYGGLLINYPRQDTIPELRPSDVVVLTTRPPVDDVDGRRTIPKTGAPLERAILDACARYFDLCRRGKMWLATDVASHLIHPDRGEIEFYTYGSASYQRFRRRGERSWHYPVEKKTTAVFVLNAPLRDGGPTLLNAFGMNGAMTLIWCYLLRTRFRELLTTPGLSMVELVTHPLPTQPATLAFADAWPATVLLRGQLSDKRGRPRTR